MTTSAAAYFDASWVDDRRVSSRAKGRLLRNILSTSVVGIGAVAALGTAAIAVTLAAGWMASSAVEPRVRLPSGPASLALVPYEPSAQPQPRAATSSWSTAFIDRSKPLIAEPGRPAVAVPTAAPAQHGARPAAIPLPRPLPAKLAQVRADLERPAAPAVAKIEPQAAQIASLEPKAAPQAVAVPMPLTRPEIKAEAVAVLQPVSKEPAAKEPVAQPEAGAKIHALAKADAASVDQKAMAMPKLSAPVSIPSVLPDSVARTAVYDISAGVVHMPDGSRLEAHSGMGEKMDDPRYIKVRMRGPTPPNVYVLTEREKLFHGVRAVRLNPVHGERMFGRDGMLAHTYMIGPTGQSNGCVSFKDYNKFLTAFLDGKVDKMVVVPDLKGTSWKTAALQADGISPSAKRYAGGYSRPRIMPKGEDSEPRYTAALGFAPERIFGSW